MKQPTKPSRLEAIEHDLRMSGMCVADTSSGSGGHRRYTIRTTADSERCYTAVGMKDLESFATGAYWARRIAERNKSDILSAGKTLLDWLDTNGISTIQWPGKHCPPHFTPTEYAEVSEFRAAINAAIAKAEGR